MTKDRGYGDMEQNKGNFGTRETHEKRDPVCGMPVAEHTGFHSSHGGKDFYFCGSTCQQSFQREPGRYIGEWADDWQHGRETGEKGNLGKTGGHSGDHHGLNEMATEFGPTGVPGTGRSGRAKAEGTFSGAPAAHHPIHSGRSGGKVGSKGGYRGGSGFGKNR